MVIHINGQAVKYVSPIFFGFLTEAAGAISAIEGLMTGSSLPIIMAKLDDIHLTILR
jgi:hypothetical protein